MPKGGEVGTSSVSSDARVGSATPCWSISTRTLPVWGTHYLPIIITIAITAMAAAVMH